MGQGDVDQSGTQPAVRIGQVGLADADLDARMPPAVRGGQPRYAPVGAVAQDADGDGRELRDETWRRRDSAMGEAEIVAEVRALLIERHPEWVGQEWIERGVGCMCAEHAA
ncbi:hypothetical protein SAMN05216276_105710 [Streptosporangium subroseum]|uniref:Uncharacterized protein n=1 Tax=Streptosporangium subroseum TaxID=106412 RepID=A0A239NFN6_9ACTN|nr:hypothetical protein [Streptosporangium subroseum]SNT53736.1 hypothetical protein SAMN05216276_105710 [Streptosporangium subroseum]